MVSGRTYRVVNLHYREAFLELAIRVLGSGRVQVQGKWSKRLRTVPVKDIKGENVPLQASGSAWQFEGENHQRYFIHTVGASEI
jgi:hypothetical protein